MGSISPTDLLILGAAVGTLCWMVVIVQWLSLSGGAQRQLVLAPLLLAFTAFIPVAVALMSTTRATFTGSAATVLNSVLGVLYLLGIGTLVVMSATRATIWSPSNRLVFSLVLLYWCVGAISNYYANLPLPRFAFFLVPILFIASWRLRPRYQAAISLLMYVSFATCVATLVLAVVDPSVAFEEPTRSSFLVSGRLVGIFEQANGMGLFASVALVLSWHSGGWMRRLGSPLCGFALIASDSRTAWFGAVIALCILFAGAEPKTRVTRRLTPFRVLLGGSLAVLAALVIAAYAVPAQQLDSFTGRTAIWNFVLQNWTTSPVIGSGPGIWPKLIAAGRVPAYVGQAHDQFFQTLYTTGIVGIVVLASLVYAWTVKSVRAARAGYWLPLALESLLIMDCVFESPLSPWAIGGEVWLLSILLFLDPISDNRSGL